MRTREELEQLEAATLAPYAMLSASSEGRAHDEAEHGYRTVYQRDRDRIIHCEAFRRLEYKTQVFDNAEGDTYRTRLTHTIEVAQIARTIARTLGLNTDLTEALALVHDLGHAAFGHAGEAALAACMAEYAPDSGGFEHNAHALRIVTQLERRYSGFRGLNLSYETREGMAKHGNYREKGSAAAYRPDDAPLLEALVADRADRLAYNHHDLDDGLSAGLLTEPEVREVAHVDEAFAAVDADAPGLPFRVRVNQVFIRLMNQAVTDLVQESSRRLREADPRSVADVRTASNPWVAFSDDGQRRQQELHEFLFSHFYEHWRVARMQEDAKREVRVVFSYFVDHPRALPPPIAENAAADGLHRAVCDLVAAMTDRELHEEHRRIVLP